MNSAFVGYEELSRSRRVLSTEAEGRRPLSPLRLPAYSDLDLSSVWFRCKTYECLVSFKFLSMSCMSSFQ